MWLRLKSFYETRKKTRGTNACNLCEGSVALKVAWDPFYYKKSAEIWAWVNNYIPLFILM